MATTLKLGKPLCIAEVGDFCGEGAVWHPEEHAVYWTDINGRRVHRLQIANKQFKTWKFSVPVTAITLTTLPDTLCLVLASGAILWRPAEDHRSAPFYQLPGWPAARCNDARADADGRLWIASMQNNIAEDGGDLPVTDALGRFFVVDGDGNEVTWKSNLLIGNTVAWSPDNQYLYTADSLRNEIYRFHCDAEGQLSEEILWFGPQERGAPDGSAVDEDGYLWNCRYGGSCILRIAPDGTVEREIEVPVPNPTTCTFGGPDLRTLYITSAAAGASKPAHTGGLFAIETNICGTIPHRFQPAALDL